MMCLPSDRTAKTSALVTALRLGYISLGYLTVQPALTAGSCASVTHTSSLPLIGRPIAFCTRQAHHMSQTQLASELT